MASPYQQIIREDLAAMGHVGKYDPADVEAWMRLEHPTLDSLSKGQFRAEISSAIACIDWAGPEQTAELRESFGF